MKLTVYIESTPEGGITCRACAKGENAMTHAEANVFAIGALEIARASLLARRWGVDISGCKQTPILPEEPEPRRRKKRAAKT